MINNEIEPAALIMVGIVIILCVTLLVFWVRYQLKKEEKTRKLEIDEALEGWKKQYQQANLILPELVFDKYSNVKNSTSRYTRNKRSTFFVDEFYEKDLNSKLYMISLIDTFGKKKALQYFTSGFEIGVKKQDILNVLGKPIDYKKEVLKTKTKETLYYSSSKSYDFYVFDNDSLVKIVK